MAFRESYGAFFFCAKMVSYKVVEWLKNTDNYYQNLSLEVLKMENALRLYERWLANGNMDEATKAELEKIRSDETEIYDRYYRELEFGTGGLRGVLGAGTNRINIYTVRKATQGFAEYIKSITKVDCKASVAIAYDSRNMSVEFAESAAEVLVANGIKAYIYPELMPTPALSFAVRHYGCQAGIMITASHNPAKYNGYKAYDADGCQLTIEAAEDVLSRINKTDIFDDVKYMNFEDALGNGIEYIAQETIDAYLAAVKSESITDKEINKKLNVVYTPLNGAGNKSVRKILEMIGVENVSIVKEQELPDGDFPTCSYPNPEKPEALALGVKLCKGMAAAGNQPDMLLATDPDCDRVGTAIAHKDDYLLLTGNEIGVLLLDFICQNRIKRGTMPKDPIAVKTIVSTTMTDAVANEYGVEVINVLTGFKFIGEQIKILEEKKQEDRYIFGFEESYGYLSKGYVRDKDAVNASMLICEMAAHYKSIGKTLVDALNDLYEKHGFYKNHLLDFYFEGAEGMKKMGQIMKDFRTSPPEQAAGRKITKSIDYMNADKTGLPAADVLEFILEDGSSFIVRPSGTEPKIKVYISAKGTTLAESEEIIAMLSKELQLA